MEHSNEENKLPYEHIADIFKEYTTPSRVQQSFANLSNTVIQTALSGQSKFVFEILQNADDAFEDQQESIEVQFILHDDYLIVHHNGKGFDFNDVERICDYASQIEDVKANDLSKTGYKGLGFKSLFNLSDCIYIYSKGYSFRFDKTYWSDAEIKPWQVIPIWCRYDELPLNQKYPYNQPVNFILRVNNVSELESQLIEVVDHPELLLYLNRINKLTVNFKGAEYFLERKIKTYGVFNIIDFYKNMHVESTWISRSYKRPVFTNLQTSISEASRFIYPSKIKNAKEVVFTFTLQCDETLKEISIIRGLCYSTLPMQLHLNLPYHINSLFILNLDRSQLHENEWNEFLMYQIGSLQLNLLKDLAKVDYFKNYVVQLLVCEIKHPFRSFNKAFLKGFEEAKVEIDWLPAHDGLHLLKLGGAWTDEIDFFKQNFQNLWDSEICPYLINYNVIERNSLLSPEAKHFTYDKLFRDFPNKYYPQLTKHAYLNFISYLYERLKNTWIYDEGMSHLRKVPFLLAKDRTLQSPENALLEERENPIPGFLMLNPIDNDYLPSNNTNSIKDWLVLLGATRLKTTIEILRKSVLEWINSDIFHRRITMKNHIGIINYLAKGMEQLTYMETEKLSERLLILTQSNKFKVVKVCYLPEVIPIKEFSNIISNDEKVSSSYHMADLRVFLTYVGVRDRLDPIDIFRKSVLLWIENGDIKHKLTLSNYKSIIEFVALHYPALERALTLNEKATLKDIPVLTCDKILEKAKFCYFKCAIPEINGLENVIAKNELVCADNISEDVCEFLTKIGVSEKIAPIDVLKRSVLKWIQDGTITKRITLDNHQGILDYIAKNWHNLKYYTLEFEQKVLNNLKMMPILTDAGVFRAACNCYRPSSDFYGNCSKDIPGIELIISSNELVSSSYHSMEEKIILLKDLGVRNLRFTDIYEKYSDHLTNPENVKWFFSKLCSYWEENKTYRGQLLSFLQQKFRSSPCLLAKNGKIYSSTELYSSRFGKIYNIVRKCILLLECKKIPEDLEKYLGFKTELEFECIKELLKAIEGKIELGEEETRIFFSMLLEQLRLKDKNEIRKHKLSLLSKENKLKIANDLYYFKEEDATCYLESCYLKRIYDMSHDDTLELADLCGVNILPFREEFTREDEIYVNSLKVFYLERLPFIVLQESKMLNEDINVILRRLYDAICAIKLYQCRNICATYSFGVANNVPYHFDHMTFYVVGKWTKRKTKIHDYLKNELHLKSDIRDIIDMEQPITKDDKNQWLSEQNLDTETLDLVEEQLKNLLSNKEQLDSLTLVENADITQSHHFEYGNKHLEDIKLLGNKELATNESFSDEIPFTNSAYSTVRDPEVITHYETTPHSTDNNVYDDSKWLAVSACKLNTDHEKQIKPSDIPVTNYSSVESVHNGFSVFPPEANCEQFDIKLLSGKHVFDFLQDHYKNKYPNSKFTVLDGIFTLRQRPHKVEFVWLNTHKEKEQSYELMTEKENENKRCFEEENKKEIPASELYSDSISEHNIQDETRLQPAFKYETNKAYVNVIRPEVITRHEPIFDSDTVQDIVNVHTKRLVQSGLEIDREKRILQSIERSNCYSSMESPHTKSSACFPELRSEKSDTKWLSEKHVFSFLQNHYKNRYPNSKFTVFDGIFELRWQLHDVEIFWLNESGGKIQSHDFPRNEEDEIKQFTEAVNKELPASELSSDASSIHHIKDVTYLQKPAIKDESDGTCSAVLKEEVITNREAKIDPVIGEDIVNVDTKWLVQSELEIDRKKQIQQSEIPNNSSPSKEVLHTESPTFSPETNSEKSDTKWLSENYVFTFLQNHYEIKYPNSQFTVFDGIFKLRRRSHKVEIIWLNSSGGKSQSYDFIPNKENEIKRDIEVANKEEIAAPESSPRESSINFVEVNSYSQKHAIKDKSNGTYDTVIEQKVITCYEATTDSIIDECIINDFTECQPQSKLGINHKKQRQQSEIPDNFYSSTESLHYGSSTFYPEANNEKVDTKWLSEKYVFAFLQDHYKNKYPNSQFTVVDGLFTLWWESNDVEIVWLNASGEKKQSYDLILKKNNEVKSLLEVKSTNYVENNDSFNINHHQFITKMNQIAAELPEHKEKYCIYHVSYTGKASVSSVEELNGCAALYKTVLLKNP